MRDYLEFDLTPVEEDCIQTGSDDYLKWQTVEYQALKNQLLRMFGECRCATIKRKLQSHDFGTYYYMAIAYYTFDEVATDYVYNIEANFPLRWDKEALKELAEAGYPLTKGRKIEDV